MTEVTVVTAAALGIAALLSAMIVWRRRRRDAANVRDMLLRLEELERKRHAVREDLDRYSQQTGRLNRSGEDWEVWRNRAPGGYGGISETDVMSLLMLGV